MGRSARQQHATSVSRGTTAAPAQKTSPKQRARYLRLRGRILLGKGIPAKAIEDLAEAERLLWTGQERELAARTLYDLAQAYARSEAHGESVHYALECESAMARGDVIDATLELRVLTFLAGAFVTLGDLPSAEIRMERAKRIAADVADPRAIGNLYFNLAVTRQRTGDAEAALLYARKALELYERMAVPAHVGSMWNTLGWLYTERRQFDRAREALDTAQRLATENADGGLEAYVLQSQAELALARGDPEVAMTLAQASIDHPGAAKRCRALSLLVKADALATTKASASEVTVAYRRAIAALEPHGPLLVARAQRSQFEALAARGELKEAAAAARPAFTSLGPVLR